MADIQLRFHADMLVLSTPVDQQLARLGFDAERDNELMLLLEPEVLSELYALESAVGVQCLVTDTAHFTPARLAHSQLPTLDGSTGQAPVQSNSPQFKDNALTLAKAAIDVVAEHNPQHILVEVGPCGLPLDASSAASLNENKDQYERVVSFFAEVEDRFDAYFLNGFTSCADLKCALMGLRKKSDKPVFASVVVGSVEMSTNPNDFSLGGLGRETLADAVEVMAEYGAQVAGFSTCAEPSTAAALVSKIASPTALPILVQLEVAQVDPEQTAPTSENPYYDADQMMPAADLLRSAGAQFLRAVGAATPSYAGALVAATLGDSVEEVPTLVEVDEAEDADFAEIADALRARINKALGSMEN